MSIGWARRTGDEKGSPYDGRGNDWVWDSRRRATPAEGTISSVTPRRPTGTRDEAASKLVDRFSLWSGAAGLIPVPVVDIVAVGGVQLEMLRRLSEIYDVPFLRKSRQIAHCEPSGIDDPGQYRDTTAHGRDERAQGHSRARDRISAFTMPVFSAGATYVIGKVFIQHFASGGTLLDFNPPDYREFIKAQKEKWNSRSAAPPPTLGASASQNASSNGRGVHDLDDPALTALPRRGGRYPERQ